MRYTLDIFSSVTLENSRTLAKEGLFTTDDLLTHLALPHQRKKFSQSTGLPEIDLTRWVGMADLVRVKGMGPKTAELFVLSDIAHNVQEFIDRIIPPPTIEERGKTGWEMLTSGIKTFWNRLLRKSQTPPSRPDNWRVRLADRSSIQAASQTLRKRLQSSKPANFPANSIPSARKLAEMVEEAQELRPRMVVEELDTNEEFRSDFKKTLLTSRRNLNNKALAITGMFIIFIILIACVMWIEYRLTPPYTDGELIDSVLYHLNYVTSNFTSYVLVFILCLMIFTYLLVMLLTSWIYQSYSLFVITQIMNNTAHQAFYRRANETPSAKIEKPFIIAIGIMSLGIIFICLYAAFYEYIYRSLDIWSNTWIPALFGIGIGLALSYSAMAKYTTNVPVHWERDRESYKRLLLLIILSILGSVAIFSFVFIFAFRLSATVYNITLDRFILPSYNTTIQNSCEQVAMQESGNDSSSDTYLSTLHLCNESIKPKLASEYIDKLQVVGRIETLLKMGQQGFYWWINNLLVWILIAGIIPIFVIPFLSLGGWWRGIFYVFLLFSASQIEDLLSLNLPQWLNLDVNTTQTHLFIWFFILVFALLFDWWYDAATESQKICPACQTLIDDNSYCPICGMAQGK